MLAQILPNLKIKSLDRLFTYRVPGHLEKCITLGSCVTVPFGNSNRKIEGYVLSLEDEVINENTKDIIEIKENKVFPDEKMLLLAKKIRDYYFISYASALKLIFLTVGDYKESFKILTATITKKGCFSIESMRKSKKKIFLKRLLEGPVFLKDVLGSSISLFILKVLLKDGLIELYKKEEKKHVHLHKLSKEQQACFNIIKKNIGKDKVKKYLLFGVTGSGKTEVYFHCIKNILNKGQQVLVMLPEINLTEQMIDRFEKAFPENVVKWHSKISFGEKKRNIEALKRKEKNILLGPRSAIFVPMENLGLIIVDEEHDNSYYQNTMPIYHGKTVALMRSEIEKATIILGSGTPSVESMFMVKTKELINLTLKKKFYNQKNPINPAVETIDMTEELRRGNYSIFSDKLRKAITNKVENGQQVLLFLNRRGYYNFLLCRDCGFVMKCDSCDLAMSYHQEKKKMVCHYCGKEKGVLKFCPECQSRRIRGIGLGTEQILQLIEKYYPNYTVARLDGDLKGGKNRKQYIIESFKKGEIDILVGTQLAAKGIDFPNVSLVGILLGDLSLNFPDYRAKEWTFQLLLQVIGRTGRRYEKGEVLLQSYRPFDIIFKKIENFDFEGFYNSELVFRETYKYPPYSEIFRLQIFGVDETKVIQKVWTIYNEIKEDFFSEELFLPKANSIKKIRDNFGWQILFKISKKNKRLAEVEIYLKNYLKKIYLNQSSQLLIYMERNPNGLL